MPSPAVTRVIRVVLRVGLVLAFVAPLASRAVAGWTFYESGAGKLENPDGVVRFFTMLGIPFPGLNAAFVSRLEYWGGLALLVGLGTRLFALLLSSTMVVALLTADKEAFLEKWTEGGLSAIPEVSPVLLLLLLSWLVTHGPGWLSLDALVARFARRRGLWSADDKPAIDQAA